MLSNEIHMIIEYDLIGELRSSPFAKSKWIFPFDEDRYKKKTCSRSYH